MTWRLVTQSPLRPSLDVLEPHSPGTHIAQFHFQVIGNCGLKSLMQCNKRAAIARRYNYDQRAERYLNGMNHRCNRSLNVRGTSDAIGGWRCTSYDGIVAWGG